LGYPSKADIPLDEHFLGRVAWPGVMLLFYALLIVVIFIWWDPFPGHSLDFLLGGEVTLCCMAFCANRQRWLELPLIAAFISVASLNEYINFLPGPGVKDVTDIYCYLGGAFVTYVGITLLRPWVVHWLYFNVIPKLAAFQKVI
jgi:hypothetical protein